MGESIKGFFIPNSRGSDDWVSIESRLAKSVRKNSARKVITTKQGHTIEYDELDAPHSKPVLDEVDKILAKDYGLTEVELDFIMSYDIKYRMSAEAESEDD